MATPEPAPPIPWVSSHRAIAILNDIGVTITYRQLDYWCAIDIFEGRRTGSGSRRMFNIVEVETMLVLSKLAPLGAEGKHMKAVAEKMRTPGPYGRSLAWEAMVVSPDLEVLLRLPAGRLVVGPMQHIDRPCWLVVYDRSVIARVRELMTGGE